MSMQQDRRARGGWSGRPQVVKKNRRPPRGKIEALSKGRIVRYVEGTEEWPAMILRVLDPEMKMVSLALFTMQGSRVMDLVRYSDAVPPPAGTWHWPPR